MIKVQLLKIKRLIELNTLKRKSDTSPKKNLVKCTSPVPSSKMAVEQPLKCGYLESVTLQCVSENLPPYQSSTQVRPSSPQVLPGKKYIDAAVTITGAASAAFSLLSLVGQASQTEISEDPLVRPIVQHLKSAAVATIDVSSDLELSKKKTKIPKKRFSKKKNVCVIHANSPSVL